MATLDNLNVSGDPGYLQLCTVLKQLVELEVYYHQRQHVKHRPTKKEYQLLTRLKDLLKQGVKINNSLENSNTPIHYAIEFNNTEIVKMLLLNGAEVNSKNEKLETPLHLALRKNATNMIHLLLKNGADPKIANHDGYTPFHFLLQYCDENMIDVFLENGVDFDFIVPGNFRKQCLKLAIARKSFRMLHFIFENSVELEEQEKFDSTVLCEAVYIGNIEIFKFLLEKGYNMNGASESVEDCFSSGEMPLHAAIRRKCKIIINFLLDQNADVNSRDESGTSILHTAVMYKASTDLINRLLKNGANLKARNNDGVMPLHYAVTGRDLDLLSFLLDKNPDHNDKDNKLAFCLSFIKDDEFRLLGDFFRPPKSHKSYSGDSSYDEDFNVESYTLEMKSWKTPANLFVERGFTLYIEDFNDIRIPEEFNCWMGDIFNNKKDRKSVESILNEKEAFSPDEIDKWFLIYKVLKGSIQRGFTSIVQNLLAPFVNVNAPSVTGYTLFHDAVIYRHLPIVNELLIHGADVNVVHDVCKMSALHLAVLNNDLDIATFLLKNNAHIEAHNKRNQTPLFLAVQKENYEMMFLLLNAGAYVDPVDVKGNSPLNTAVDSRSFDIMEILLYFGAFVDAENLRKICKNHFNFSSDVRDVLEMLFNHSAFNFNLNPSDFLQTYSQKIKIQEFMVKYVTFNGSSLNFLKDSNMNDFQIKCHEEIERMKLKRIEESNLSIHDILFKSERQIGICMRNEKIDQILESMDFIEAFPIYGRKLEVHLKKGKMAMQLLKIGYFCLEPILKFVFPAVVIHKIVSCLSDSELRWLIFISPIDNELKATVQYNGDEEDSEDYEEYESEVE